MRRYYITVTILLLAFFAYRIYDINNRVCDITGCISSNQASANAKAELDNIISQLGGIYTGLSPDSQLYKQIQRQIARQGVVTFLSPTLKAIAAFKSKHQLSDAAFKEMQEEIIMQHVSFDDIHILQPQNPPQSESAQSLSQKPWLISQQVGESYNPLGSYFAYSSLEINGAHILSCQNNPTSYRKGQRGQQDALQYRHT